MVDPRLFQPISSVCSCTGMIAGSGVTPAVVTRATGPASRTVSSSAEIAMIWSPSPKTRSSDGLRVTTPPASRTPITAECSYAVSASPNAAPRRPGSS